MTTANIKDFGAVGMTDQELAGTACACIEELLKREQEGRHAQLEAANAMFPQLREAFKAAGITMDRFALQWQFKHFDWSDVPVIYGPDDRYYGPKPKNRREAMAIARKFGDGNPMTFGEAWAFAAGFGPVIERAMHKMGFGGRGEPPPLGYRDPRKATLKELTEPK